MTSKESIHSVQRVQLKNYVFEIMYLLHALIKNLGIQHLFDRCISTISQAIIIVVSNRQHKMGKMCFSNPSIKEETLSGCGDP